MAERGTRPNRKTPSSWPPWNLEAGLLTSKRSSVWSLLNNDKVYTTLGTDFCLFLSNILQSRFHGKLFPKPAKSGVGFGGWALSFHGLHCGGEGGLLYVGSRQSLYIHLEGRVLRHISDLFKDQRSVEVSRVTNRYQRLEHNTAAVIWRLLPLPPA